MQIWLKTNIVAHNFISESYWQGSYELVKKMLLDATIFVYEENNVILRFIGLSEIYVAGIFIDLNNQSKGIDKALHDYVKKNCECIYFVLMTQKDIAFRQGKGMFFFTEENMV